MPRALSKIHFFGVLPGVEEAFVMGEADIRGEKLAEAVFGQEGGAGAVGDDSAIAHHDDAFHFGNDVGYLMGDEEDGGSLLGEGAHEGAEFSLGGEVEGVGGFVEQEAAG